MVSVLFPVAGEARGLVRKSAIHMPPFADEFIVHLIDPRCHSSVSFGHGAYGGLPCGGVFKRGLVRPFGAVYVLSVFLVKARYLLAESSAWARVVSCTACCA